MARSSECSSTVVSGFTDVSKERGVLSGNKLQDNFLGCNAIALRCRCEILVQHHCACVCAKLQISVVYLIYILTN